MTTPRNTSSKNPPIPTSNSKNTTLSIIIPIYNEAPSLPFFLDTLLLPELAKLPHYHFELIFINDGSTDSSLDILSSHFYPHIPSPQVQSPTKTPSIPQNPSKPLKTPPISQNPPKKTVITPTPHYSTLDEKSQDLPQEPFSTPANPPQIPPNCTPHILSFSRNFGKESALTAGLRHATGSAALMIDADGQQPPALIPEFISHWEQGADIVIGVRDKFTKHGLIQRLGSKIFYRLLRFMGSRSTVPGSTDFRLLDRVVIDEFNRLSEHNRITRGLIDWLGFRQIHLPYTYGTRHAGRPSYNLKKLFQLAIDSFVSLSTTPLVIFGYLGVAITIFSFLLGSFVLINQYLLGDPLGLHWNGAIQMAIFITFLVGLVLISQAITALYISHIHAESKNRPLYIINPKTSHLPAKQQGTTKS